MRIHMLGNKLNVEDPQISSLFLLTVNRMSQEYGIAAKKAVVSMLHQCK